MRPLRVGIIGLGVYLFLRYGPLAGRVEGLEGFTAPDGIAATWIGGLLLSLGFVAIGLGIVGGDRLIAIWLRNCRTFRLGVLVALVLFAVPACVAKFNYAPYVDETRDEIILRYLAPGSLSLYLKDVSNIDGATEEDIEYLGWAQELHPPGHYILGALLADAPPSLVAWRFLYALPLFAALVFAWLLSGRRRSTGLIFFCVVAFLIASTYLRNYTFIRMGNELLPLVCMTAFLAVLFAAERRGGWTPATLALAALAFGGGLFSKSSSVVTLFAVIGALTVMLLARRRRPTGNLLLGTVLVLVVAGAAYVLAFQGTHMLSLQAKGYGIRVLHSLRLVSIDEAQAIPGDLVVGRRPLAYFALRFPFQYGPVVLGLLAAAVWALGRRRVRVTPVDIFLLLFFALNVTGVLLVNPRVQYTAPMMAAAGYFVFSVLLRWRGPVETARIALISLLFGVAEVVAVL